MSYQREKQLPVFVIIGTEKHLLERGDSFCHQLNLHVNVLLDLLLEDYMTRE